MTTKIKFWQWPNLLAFDACVAALVWLQVFSTGQSAELSTAAYAVLALSVWLTYMADRLFDVARRGEARLLSARHQFAKRNMRGLWLVWGIVLLADLRIATTGLDPSQLDKGFVLFCLCLAYTGLNHLLSKRFFPKELLVALIFAGGTQVFLPEYTEWQCLTGYVLLCLINCLMIGWKETAVDAMLEVRSLTSVLDRRRVYPLLAAGTVLAWFSSCPIALLPSMLALGGLQFCRDRFGQERFRVLCDAALLVGPLLYLFVRA